MTEDKNVEGEDRQARQRHWEQIVAGALDQVEAALLATHPAFHHLEFFGALGIHPQHLAIWCFFKSEADLRQARESGFTQEIQEHVRTALFHQGFPAALATQQTLSFASDEQVQKTCQGNYWHFLK
jgi:hypothetical protein